MAAHQLIAPLPLLTLDAGCTITVEAIDPDSGANVTGVVVSQVAIYATVSAASLSGYVEPDNAYTFTGTE